MTAILSARDIAGRGTRPADPVRPSALRIAIERAVMAHPLAWLMLLGAVLRVWAALTPGFHHPDAIYQYLEPAHRMLTGEGVVTWEWRTGIRSWMLPALLAIPLGIGETIDPDGMLPMILPRLATAAASLGIIWAAWDIGRRHSATTGLLAGFVAATWFEMVFFAAETLAEPIAVAAFLPAAAWLTARDAGPRRIAAAGALFAFAALARPHYAPAAAVLVLVEWRRDLFDWRRWTALLAGAVAVAALSAAIDGARGLVPFAWILGNFEQNIVHNVSARYGTFPALSYVAWFMEVWSWWMVPAVIGIRYGWRQAPGLLAAAAVTLVIHSLIPHKEYRFIFLGFTVLAILAALGWGKILALARRRLAPARARMVTVGVFAAFSLASIGLAQGKLAPNQLRPNTDGWRTFAHLRADPAVCGVALVKPASFANLPGAVALRRGTPISMFWTGDPADPADRPWANALAHQTRFNRIVTATATGGALRVPAGWHVDHCERSWNVRMCILARPGRCRGPDDFAINRAMARTGL